METRNNQGFAQRNATCADIAAIAELLNASAQKQYGTNRAGEDEIQTWFRSEKPTPQEDTQCWLDTNGRMVAFAQVYRPDFPPLWDAYQDATVHPETEGERTLWATVLDWCEVSSGKLCHAMRPDVGLICGARIHDTDNAKLREYLERGYMRACTETLMQRSLVETLIDSAIWPEGIHVRQLDLVTDLEAYATAYGEAFRDHWGSCELGAEQLIRSKQGEFLSWGNEYIPELWFVALDDDELIGSVGSFVNHGGTPDRSYLYHVFVRPAWRRRGIAKALLLHAFQAIAARGCATVELHVESKNPTGALQLYESVGMNSVWRQHAHEKTLPVIKT